MSYLKRYTKSPTEQFDFDLDFTSWLAERGDTIASFTTDADFGMAVVAALQIGSSGVIRVYVDGGVAGRAYTVECEVTTASLPPRVKRASVQVRVRGAPPIRDGTYDAGAVLVGDDDSDDVFMDGGTV